MNKLILDPIKHIYTLDGVLLPSVTQILKGVGIIDFSNVPPSRLEAACKFGTAVHRATELWDKLTLDEITLDPHLRPYLDGWILFCKDFGFTSSVIEVSMCSKIYRFAGTPDRLGNWNKDDSIIIPDIKTSFELSPATKIQLAGYDLMVKENAPNKKIRTTRLSVLLNEKGTYKLEIYKDKNDTNIFIAALSVYNWKGRNGK